MYENSYDDLIQSTKMNNRALARTNVNVEALKRRIGGKLFDFNYIAANYGKELLLILQNYLIQKYYKKYGVYTEGSFKDGRLFFYTRLLNEERKIVGCIDINKGKFYLSQHIAEQKDMLSAILSYCIIGFEEIERQILESYLEINKNKNNSNSSDITLSLFQLTTVGNCLGYLDVVVSSDELSDLEANLMDRHKADNFLIKCPSGVILINRFNGDLIFPNNEKIDYKIWCNDKVGDGLKYLICSIEEKYYERNY